MSSDEKLEDYFDLAPDDLDYLLLCSSKYEFIFVRNLKVASSTIVQNLYRLVAGRYPDSSRKIFERNKRLFPSFLFDGGEQNLVQLLAARRYFTFTFVRNPYTKILSAYLFLIENVNERSERAVQIESQLGVPELYELTFLEFLLRVRETAPNEMNGHWRPQWLSLGLNKKMQYDFIGRFEHLDRDLKQVLGHLNQASVEDWKIGSNIIKPTHANDKLAKYYGHDEQALVAEIYKDDFRLLGYGDDLPL